MLQLTPFSKRFIRCPKCNEGEHAVEHLIQPKSCTFGPWHCYDCEIEFRGTVHPSGAVDVEITPAQMVPALHLLRGQGLWLLVEGFCDPDGSAPNSEYFYTEHTYPVNIMSSTVGIWSNEGDPDPHGIFEPVAHVARRNAPGDLDNIEFPDLLQIFGLTPNSFSDMDNAKRN